MARCLKPRAPHQPPDTPGCMATVQSTNLHLATWGFRKVRPSRCTSFTPSFRSKVWLLSGSLQLSRHWRTVAAANTEHPAQFAGKGLCDLPNPPTPPDMHNIKTRHFPGPLLQVSVKAHINAVPLELCFIKTPSSHAHINAVPLELCLRPHHLMPISTLCPLSSASLRPRSPHVI